MRRTPTQRGLQPTEIPAFETTPSSQFTYTDSSTTRLDNSSVETIVGNVKSSCIATLVAAYPRILDCWSVGHTRDTQASCNSTAT